MVGQSIYKQVQIGTLIWERNSLCLYILYIYVSFDPVNSAFENLFYRNTGKSEKRKMYHKEVLCCLVIAKDYKHTCISGGLRKS